MARFSMGVPILADVLTKMCDDDGVCNACSCDAEGGEIWEDVGEEEDQVKKRKGC
jgi:hypothetical protein